MNFYAGKSPFLPPQRDMSSSSMLFPDVYFNTLTRASMITSQVHGVTLGPKSQFVNMQPVQIQHNQFLTLQHAQVVNIPINAPQENIFTPRPNMPLPITSSTPKKLEVRRTTSDQPTLGGQNHEMLQKRPSFDENVKKCPDLNPTCAHQSQFNSENIPSSVVTSKFGKRAMDMAEIARRVEKNVKIHNERQLSEASENFQNAKKQWLQRTAFNPAINDVVKENNNELKKETEYQGRSNTIKLIEAKKKQKEIDMEIYLAHDGFNSLFKKLKINIANCKNPMELGKIAHKHITIANECRAAITKQKEEALSRLQTQKDLDNAKRYIVMLKDVLDVVSKECDRINSNFEEEKRREVLKVKAEEERLRLEQEKAAEAEKAQDASNTTSEQKHIDRYMDFKNLLDHVETTLENLLKDEKFSSFCFDLLKAVNIPVNAIHSDSQKMKDNYQKLRNLLLGGVVPGKSFRVDDHPLGRLYVRYLIAKGFVLQGENFASSKPELAFPYASILISLWVEFPELGQLVQSYLICRCIYLVPLFPVQEGEPTEDYLKFLGYYVRDGVAEDKELFLKRVKGMIRLYSALMVSTPRTGAPNPLGLCEAWRLLTSVCNVVPDSCPDVYAVLVKEVLEVVGRDFLTCYGIQARKFLRFLQQVYFPALSKVATSPAHLHRLELFLKKISQEGFAAPVGRLPPNFW